jgi:archaeosine synthase beta-subunit
MVAQISGIPFDYELKYKYSPIYKTAIKQLTLSIPGGGCKLWLDTKGRCCPFCGFNGLVRSILTGDDSEDNYEGWLLETSTFTDMYKKAVNDIEDFDKLAVFNGGSFLIDTEIPADFRRMLYEDFAKHPTARQLMIESIPDGITKEVLDEAKNHLGTKDFMVGIGLESADNHVRNKLLKKATSLKRFEEAVRLLQSYGMQVFVYTFLKAPGLSEREALDDVIKTMTYLTDLGVDEIGLSCAFVQTDTPLEHLYRNGDFRPPWLWTILEIMNLASKHNWPLSIGGFSDQPPPIAIASNCKSCDDDIHSAIDKYRSNAHMPRKEIYCTCKEDWNREIQCI